MKGSKYKDSLLRGIRDYSSQRLMRTERRAGAVEASQQWASGKGSGHREGGEGGSRPYVSDITPQRSVPPLENHGKGELQKILE